MLYTQYKDASLKHLQACKTALYGLKFYKGASGVTTSTPNPSRDALLFNIFYLSGYTLECIINFAIYKKIGWTTNVQHMSNSHYSICYNIHQHSLPFRPTYSISQHKFNKNIQLLNNLLPGNNIPLINPSIPIHSNPNIEKMLLDTVSRRRNTDCWKPDLRYNPVSWFFPKYTEQDVHDLVSLTEDIYIKLQNV
jgi:hypothetical protein